MARPPCRDGGADRTCESLRLSTNSTSQTGWTLTLICQPPPEPSIIRSLFFEERSPALSARCQANEKSCAMTRQGPWTPEIGSNGRMVPSFAPTIRPVCLLTALLRTADRPKRPRHCWQREERLVREAASDRPVAPGRQSAAQRAGFP